MFLSYLKESHYLKSNQIKGLALWEKKRPSVLKIHFLQRNSQNHTGKIKIFSRLNCHVSDRPAE